MRHSPLLVLPAGSALALSACGGSGSSSDTGSEVDTGQLGNTGSGTDATATGPVTIDGAQKGGIVTVLTNTGLTTTIDPAEAYYLDTMSIDGQLITRSLTQYKYDPTSKQMVLVPDLATDLGQHNDDYTKWTFTIRDGVKFEDGSPVTAKNIAWGIQRCMDAATFPTGPCQYYSNVYFRGGSTYKGPYTAPNQKFTAVKVDGNKLTIFMDKPFPDMPYWGAFPANGPVPLGKASDPTTYKNHPVSTGPYMIKSFSPSKELVLQAQPALGPDDRPGAHGSTPTATTSRPSSRRRRSTRSCSSDSGSRADDADLRQPARARLPDDEGEVAPTDSPWAASPARSTGDRTTARSPTSASVRRCRGPTPTRTPSWPVATSRGSRRSRPPT